MRRIVVDLAGFSGVTPTFLKFLVRLQSEAGDFDYVIHLVGVTPCMKRILETMGITRIFTYEMDAGDAILLRERGG